MRAILAFLGSILNWIILGVVTLVFIFLIVWPGWIFGKAVWESLPKGQAVAALATQVAKPTATPPAPTATSTATPTATPTPARIPASTPTVAAGTVVTPTVGVTATVPLTPTAPGAPVAGAQLPTLPPPPAGQTYAMGSGGQLLLVPSQPGQAVVAGGIPVSGQAVTTTTGVTTVPVVVSGQPAPAVCRNDKIGTWSEVAGGGPQRIEVTIRGGKYHLDYYRDRGVQSVSIIVQDGESAVMAGFGSAWFFPSVDCASFDNVADATQYAAGRAGFGHSGIVYGSLRDYLDNKAPVVNLRNVDPARVRPTVTQ